MREQKTPAFLLPIQKQSLYLQCVTFETGDETFANPCRIGLFYGRLARDIVPTPVWSVNAPTACFRCNATGKRYFCFLR